MLYDHAIVALHDAIKAIEENNIEKRWKANTKACDIITHLWTTLDVEGGGEIARNLDQLFGFMMTKLPEVDFKNNPQPARDVIKLLEPLRSAWKELLDSKTEQELNQALADAKNATPAASPETSQNQASPQQTAAQQPPVSQPAAKPAAPAYPGKSIAAEMPSAPAPAKSPSSTVSISA